MSDFAFALRSIEDLTPDGKIKPEILVMERQFMHMILSREQERNKDLAGMVYYTSTNQTDFAELSVFNDSASVINLMSELNVIYKGLKWKKFDPNMYKKDVQLQHDERWQIKRLQNELFDLGFIPVLSSNVWVNGAVLTTNNVAVSKEIFESVFMLNWYEQNENPMHWETLGINAVKPAKPTIIDEIHRHIYFDGYRVKFDRRFNLWRLTEKIEFDDKQSKP